MFHLSCYNASIANGAVLLQVAAITDPLIAPSGNGFLVPTVINKLMRVAAFGTNLTRVQLTSASLRDFAPFDVGPVNVGTLIATPANFADFSDAPIPLIVNEELDAFGVQSNAGAQRTRRNILKMGPILASAFVAKTNRASALPCAAVLKCHCFLKGTKIRTADGERNVESLGVGDLLPTMLAECAPSSGSGVIRSRKAIRRNAG